MTTVTGMASRGPKGDDSRDDWLAGGTTVATIARIGKPKAQKVTTVAKIGKSGGPKVTRVTRIVKLGPQR